MASASTCAADDAAPICENLATYTELFSRSLLLQVPLLGSAKSSLEHISVCKEKLRPH